MKKKFALNNGGRSWFVNGLDAYGYVFDLNPSQWVFMMQKIDNGHVSWLCDMLKSPRVPICLGCKNKILSKVSHCLSLGAGLPLGRKLRVKIKRGDWYPPTWCHTKKRDTCFRVMF
ncbi:hypothetical protein TNCV_4010501 [Trichonephila clavipes]|nr:hypothetical protein TNCV_4010501 [Trichonephila clavipes]